MSERIQELIDAMDDDALSTLYRQNSLVLDDYHDNYYRMKRIVNLMSIEMAKRGIEDSIEYNNGHTYDRT